MKPAVSPISPSGSVAVAAADNVPRGAAKVGVSISAESGAKGPSVSMVPGGVDVVGGVDANGVNAPVLTVTGS